MNVKNDNLKEYDFFLKSCTVHDPLNYFNVYYASLIYRVSVFYSNPTQNNIFIELCSYSNK